MQSCLGNNNLKAISECEYLGSVAFSSKNQVKQIWKRTFSKAALTLATILARVEVLAVKPFLSAYRSVKWS
jgi:hypothetical protein